MSFGAVFGTLFFVVLGLWLAGSGVEPSWLHPVAGRACLSVTALVLAAGLLTRQRWARWGGVSFGTALAAAVAMLGPLGTGTAALMVLFGSIAVAAALALPASGRISAPAERSAGGVGLGRFLASAAVVAAAGLGANVVWGLGHGVSAPAAAAVQASSLSRVSWTPYGPALERARTAGQPLLVAFVTDWCGYCRKMDRTTWKNPAVVERLNADVVPVRVNADEAVERGGYTGRDLASRFGVYGYPTYVLLDAEGDVLSRTGGYLKPQEFLGWLDGALAASAAGRRTATAPVVTTTSLGARAD